LNEAAPTFSIQLIAQEVHMGRDKAKDDRLFNCSEPHEADYVAGLYPGHEEEVRELLQKLCLAGEIKNSTHLEVYRLIKEKLKLSIPLIKLRTLDKPKPKK
jgi:hypothetical protein